MLAKVPLSESTASARIEKQAAAQEIRAPIAAVVLKSNVRLGLITTFGKAETTFVNLSDPSKSVTIRGGGAWHDTLHPDGSILGRMNGHSFVVGDVYKVSLFIGDWTVIIRPDGAIQGAPVGGGQWINLCDVIA